MSAEPVAAQIRWGSAADGLRLGIAADGPIAHLFLEDVGDEPIEVMSHVEAEGEPHFDWFTILVDGVHTILLAGRRNRSAPVRRTLAPGERLHHAVDVPVWAGRAPNLPLEAGEHEARARYEVEPGRAVWSGRLEAGPVMLAIP
jgi:hypothetical protein